VVALDSQENGLLNFRVIDGRGEGEVSLSGAGAVAGVPLGCNDAVETVDADGLCARGIVLIEDCVGVRSCEVIA